MTRILYKWGAKPFLDQLSGCREEIIGIMDYVEPEFIRDQAAEFRFLRTQALKNILQLFVNNEAITVVSGTVSSITIASDNMTTQVTVGDGRIFNADFVVCADGYDSALNDMGVTGSEREEYDTLGWPASHLAMTFALPTKTVRRDEALCNIFRSSKHWNVWAGPGYILHANISDESELVCVTITANYNREIFEGDQTWQLRPLEYWNIDLGLFEPRVKKLLELAGSVSSRIFVRKPMLDELVCTNSRVVLVGDAAHPILPGGNQHIGLDIEEAETLRCLFSRIEHRNQIPDFLVAYEDIRLPRTSHIVEYERGMHLMLQMPDGPQQEARDVTLKKVMAGDWDHMDEELFRAIFGEEFQQYSCDATEEVEDWWTKWGGSDLEECN
ncbi:FAD-dependent monooxygenase OpS4 [Psilocybe cubensis]|uniref:FAD-dependent monooxygenase OpS4 n=2 Tax=Psilocybe cubensis TaxID=181762 RepID=A0ACB8GFT0_PSICU|nr:FAD-dependent monooxygenase OpS4 [Psilocybe cubensis]KAH9474458.1 FAD-dependent monooxygenase OpS4 [Psilocybe cubensis]